MPALLTGGVIAYAISVLASEPTKQMPQAARSFAQPEQLRGSVGDTTKALLARGGRVGQESQPFAAGAPGAPVVRSQEPAAPQSLVSAFNVPPPAPAHPVVLNAAEELPRRDVQIAEDARAVQRRLADLGHFSGVVSGFWGPVSRAALRSFKEANGLPNDASWDTATEQSLFRFDAVRAEPFVGRWAADLKACSHKAAKSGHLPTVIETSRARAGETSCSFTEKQRAASHWRIVAQCASGKEKWTAHIELAVLGNRLTWKSERGSQEYVRCQQPIDVAEAGAGSGTTLARLR